MFFVFWFVFLVVFVLCFIVFVFCFVFLSFALRFFCFAFCFFCLSTLFCFSVPVKPVTREAVFVIHKKLVSSGNKKPVSGVQQIDCV